MKSIIYILLAVFLCGIVISAVPKSMLQKKQVVQIQSMDKRANAALLQASGSIINNRLKAYGLQRFEVAANEAQQTIDITFTEKVDVSEILPLVLSKGKMEFYETCDRHDVLKLFGKDDKLYLLLNIPLENPEINTSAAILGYCSAQNKPQVDAYIAQHVVNKPVGDCKYLWSDHATKEGNYILYVVKPQAAMDKSQVQETAIVSQPNKPDQFDLMLTFNQNGALVWQNLSKSNIGKSIAIVLDNVVYCAPVVKDEISNGKCVISGNFSAQEILRLKALVGNEDLPLAFEAKK